MTFLKRLHKKLRRKWLLPLGCSAILLSLVAVVALPNLSSSHLPDTSLVEAKITGQIDPNIPKVAYPCLPDNASKLDILGEVSDNKQTYYLIRANYENRNTYWEPLIAVKNQSCNSLNATEDKKSVSLEILVNENLAIELSKKRYQTVINEIGGADKLEAELARQAKESERLLMPKAFYKALKELKIKLPKNLHPTSQLKPEQFTLGLNMH